MTTNNTVQYYKHISKSNNIEIGIFCVSVFVCVSMLSMYIVCTYLEHGLIIAFTIVFSQRKRRRG